MFYLLFALVVDYLEFFQQTLLVTSINKSLLNKYDELLRTKVHLHED